MSISLVTGGSGFIGGHLVETLRARGEAVRCLVRATSKTERLESLGAELVTGELSDPTALERALQDVSTVYHLAGLTQALRWRSLYSANVLATESVVHAAARQSNPPTTIVVSSVAAAGPARPGQTRRAADPPAPVSDYGRSKRMAEVAASRFADRVPLTIVRPGVVFGPRGRQMLPVFQMIARARMHFVPFFNPPPLSVIDVRDLVEAVIRAAERGQRLASSHSNGRSASRSNGCYFAAADETPNWRELGIMIAQAGEYRGMIPFYCPTPLPWLIAAGSDALGRATGMKVELTIDKIREAAVASWVCSTEETRADLGFVPSAPLRDRLRETIDWYREAKWL